MNDLERADRCARLAAARVRELEAALQHARDWLAYADQWVKTERERQADRERVERG